MEITQLISSHDQIDADIQSVKDRNKKIHKIFLVVDILVTLDEETDELEEASSAIDRSE